MKRLLPFILVLICVPVSAQIAHDVSTVFVWSTTSSTCSFSHLAGSPDLALLFILLDANEAISGSPTYGGANMALVGTSGSASASSDQKVFLYELHSPSSGTQTVAMTMVDGDNHGACLVHTFTGTDATDATVEFVGYDNSGSVCATATTTITLDSTDSWMVTASVWNGADMGTFTETNFTERHDTTTGPSTAGADDALNEGDSTGDTGSLTHTSTHSGPSDDECAQVSVELIKASTAAARRVSIVGAKR